MPEPYSAPKVLISYSHDSPGHMARVLGLSDRLRAEGVDSHLDQYETSPPEGWPRWTLNQIEWADFVLVVCTATYDRRFRGREEAGKGRGVTWEGAVLTQDLYDAAAHNTKFIPVVFSEEDVSHVPLMLRGATFYPVNTEEGYEALYRRLTNQPLTQKPGLGRQRPLPPRPHHAPGDGQAWPAAEAAVTPPPGRVKDEGGGMMPHAPPGTRRGLLYALLALAACSVLVVGYWRLVYVPSHNRSFEYLGLVMDAETGKVVRRATVTLETRGGPLVTRTDSDGRFRFELSQPTDTTRIRVEADGYEMFERIQRLRDEIINELPLRRMTQPSTPTPTPSPAPTRRPIIPRPSPGRTMPCTIERRARGLC